jgi:hypothetical protein
MAGRLKLIADNLSKAGWSWGFVSAVDSRGRTIFVADAHRDGQRFVVRAASWLDKPWPVKAGSAARHLQAISGGSSKLNQG